MDRYQQAPDWMSDAEVDDLVALTERPEAWPAEHRRSLPLIRDLVSLWQRQRAQPAPGQLTAEDIARRIGA